MHPNIITVLKYFSLKDSKFWGKLNLIVTIADLILYLTKTRKASY